MPFEFIDELATADIAFRARGATLEETFAAAAEALTAVMVENPASVRPVTRLEVRLENEDLDLLLFDFLQEMIFHKDASGLLLRSGELALSRSRGVHRLEAVLLGESIDPSRHQLRLDVKAVTLHRFTLKRARQGWEATVLLDV